MRILKRSTPEHNSLKFIFPIFNSVWKLIKYGVLEPFQCGKIKHSWLCNLPFKKLVAGCSVLKEKHSFVNTPLAKKSFLFQRFLIPDQLVCY